MKKIVLIAAGVAALTGVVGLMVPHPLPWFVIPGNMCAAFCGVMVVGIVVRSVR